MRSYQTEIEDFHVPADIETNVGYPWTKESAMRFNEDFWIQNGHSHHFCTHLASSPGK